MPRQLSGSRGNNFTPRASGLRSNSSQSTERSWPLRDVSPPSDLFFTGQADTADTPTSDDENLIPPSPPPSSATLSRSATPSSELEYIDIYNRIWWISKMEITGASK